MKVSVELGVIDPSLGPVFVCIGSESVGMQVSVQRRHAGDGAGRDRVLLAAARVVVQNRILGGDADLASHDSRVQTNGLLDNGAEVRQLIDFGNGWDLASHEAGRRELLLKLLRLDWLSEEVIERASERVCYGISPYQPDPRRWAQVSIVIVRGRGISYRLCPRQQTQSIEPRSLIVGRSSLRVAGYYSE